MKSSREDLKKRGYINETDLQAYVYSSPQDLLKLLKSARAYERTVAVRLLERNTVMSKKELSEVLLLSLTIEKSLYTRLEICNVLAKGDIQTAQMMIAYLGKIGNNQYDCLPDRVSQKMSYPLPRDIIARTLGKMNVDILAVLLDTLGNNEISVIREALDAIGYMCFYNEVSKKEIVREKLIKCCQSYKADEIIRWKIVRALSSFSDKHGVAWLEMISRSDKERLIRDEAERSLKIMKKRYKKSLED